jgi:hypothetical protein
MHDHTEDDIRSAQRLIQTGQDETLRRVSDCEIRTAVNTTRIGSIEERLTHLVSMAEFLPVKWVIYGGIGTALAAVLTALMAGILSGTSHTLTR